ncbi:MULTISPECIES: hypothetical protein [Clostridium]|uniref:hypothetical protein n=1 Tax=Clostridium TaxID=1485 RepID=UPI000A5C7279|nr:MULTISPECIES: hypothetical protein [Clostridium]
MKNLVAILNLVLVFFAILTAYFLASQLFKGSRGKIEEILCYFDDKYRKRFFNRRLNSIYKEKTKSKVLDKLDEIMYLSGIRNHFKCMTSEIFVFFILIVSLILSFVVFKIYKSFIFSLIAFFSVQIISYAVLKEMMRINFDRIDNSIMFFISSLKNNAAIKNNIIFMMEESTSRLKEPLKTYNMDFIRDVKMGIPMKKAFDNYINKIENIRLKNILKNLYICSLNNANYSKLLDKTRIVIKNYYEGKEKRRRKVIGAQISIAVIIFVAGIILNALSGITNNFYALLMKTTVGQIIVAYMVCVLVFAAYECITLKKFNY